MGGKVKRDLTETIRSALELELAGISRHEDLTDRMAIIDKAIKFEMMRRKGGDEGFGDAFNEEGE